jgi:hypothetical protein
MRLSAALKEKRMDVRLRDKYTAESVLSSSEVQNYYKNLEDDETRMTTTYEVDLAMNTGDDDPVAEEAQVN